VWPRHLALPGGTPDLRPPSVSDNLRLGAVAQRDAKAVAADLDMVFTLFPLLKGTVAAGRRDAVGRGEQQMLRSAAS
jgi:ABC-type branched-subunit amino acid transport system ATPase component